MARGSRMVMKEWPNRQHKAEQAPSWNTPWASVVVVGSILGVSMKLGVGRMNFRIVLVDPVARSTASRAFWQVGGAPALGALILR